MISHGGRCCKFAKLREVLGRTHIGIGHSRYLIPTALPALSSPDVPNLEVSFAGVPMRRVLSAFFALWAIALPAHAQTQGYYRQPSIHNSTIVFVAEGDL